MSRPRRSLLQPRRPTRPSESSLGDTPAPVERAERTERGGGEDTVPLVRASSPSASQTVSLSEPTVPLPEPPRDDTVPRGPRPASLETTVELPPPEPPAAEPAPSSPPARQPEATQEPPRPAAPRPAAVFTPFRRMFTRGDVPRPAGSDSGGPPSADLLMAGGLVLLGLGAVAAGAAAGTFGWLVTMGR